MEWKMVYVLCKVMVECTNSLVGVILFCCLRAGYIEDMNGWGYGVRWKDVEEIIDGGKEVPGERKG